MAKRGATSELNRDNWDQEDEAEDAGHYSVASNEELKNRVIRKARRTLTNTDSGEKKSAFSGFGGFGKTNKISWNSLESSEKIKQNGCEESSTKKLNMELGEPAKTLHPSETSKTEEESKDSGYYQNLKKLNETFLHWVQEHMSKNPFCNFTPVCKDYQDHVAKLDGMFPSEKHTASASTNVRKSISMPFKIPPFMPAKSPSQNSLNDSSTDANKSDFSNSKNQEETPKKSTESGDSEMSYGAGFKSCTTNTSTFSFGKATKTATCSGSPLGPAFSQGALGKADNENSENKETDTEKKSPTLPPFKFQFKPNPLIGFSSDNKTEAFKFSATPTNTKFSFGTPTATSSVDANEDDEVEYIPPKEEEYVPPKNESTTIVEDDAFYTKRCKLFFKKRDAFTEKGIGMLYLKPLDGKTQLLIRNDTNIGTVLLNIILSSAIPVAKSGKNNILLTCVPNPPLDPNNPDSKETIPILIRVKTSEDADELLNKLKESKS